MKIQYPGVDKSIETDVANITLLLKRFNILPRGMYADSAIRTAKKELKWECDYIREADFAEKFARLLAKDPVFVVPKVFHDLTTRRVFTAEFFDGLVLDDCVDLPQEIRNWVSGHLIPEQGRGWKWVGALTKLILCVLIFLQCYFELRLHSSGQRRE